MRFLMLTTFYPPWSFGGDAQVVHDLAHALAERGHDVTVAHSIASYRLLEGNGSPPLELEAFAVYQAWHPRVQNDPVHAWFRGVVAAAARG